MNVKQIGAVFQHEFFSQWRSLTYWGIILWPLAIGLVFAKYAQWQLPEQIQKLSSQQVAFIWGVGTPTFIFMLCLSYATIMASSVASDKTNKRAELLLSMVGAKEQLAGKVLAVYGLIAFQLSCYGIGFCLYSVWDHNPIGSILLSQTPPFFIGYVVIDIVVAMLMVLVWTTEIAAYVNDDAQTALAVIPVMILIMTGTAVAVLLNVDWRGVDLGAPLRIIFNLGFAMPPVGSMLFPTLIINQGFSYFEAILNLVLELAIMILIFRTSVKQYQRGLLSTDKKNPFMQALSNDPLTFHEHGGH